MRKLLLLLAFIGTIGAVNAQGIIGVGYGNGSAEISGGGATFEGPNVDVISISIGGVTDLSDDFELYYGAGFGTAADDFGDDIALSVGLAPRYYLGESFFISGGIGAGINLSGGNEYLKDISISAGPGIGIVLSDSVDLLAGYSWSINDVSKIDGVSVSSEAFSIGLQFKL